MFPGRLAMATGTWVARPDMAAFADTDLSALSAGVTAFSASLVSSSTLGGMQLTTSLPAVLAGIGANLAVARSLLAISALQLLVLAAAALLAVARLLAAQREAETALLTARGATRWQLARLTAAEVIPLAAVTAAVGGTAGIWLARLLGGTLGNWPGPAAESAGLPRAACSMPWPPRSPSPCSRPGRCYSPCCGPPQAAPEAGAADRP